MKIIATNYLRYRCIKKYKAIIKPLLLFILAIFVLSLSKTYNNYRIEKLIAEENLIKNSRLITTFPTTIEYATADEGYPILLIHGAGGGYDQGLYLSQFVGSNFQKIAVSRFGYLRTPIPQDASPTAMADAYVKLLDELGIEKTAIVAISRGGPSAIQFAIRHPDRCSALVLLSAISHTPSPESFLQSSVFNTIFESDYIFWLITNQFKSQLISVFGVPQQAQKELTKPESDWISRFLSSMHPISLRKSGIKNDRKYKIHEYQLEEISVPTLIIHAKDDSLIPFNQGEYAAKYIPKARFVMLDNGGHLLMGHHQEVKQQIYVFLNETF